jgi:hypothetical protein
MAWSTSAGPAFVREPEGNGVAERFIRTLEEQRTLFWFRLRRIRRDSDVEEMFS